MRAIRKHDFLYIRNFLPDRWPSGGPERNYRDCDGGPTKTFLLKHRDAPDVKQYFDLAFARRPAEELYDITADPHEWHNLADDPKLAEVKSRLKTQLDHWMKAQGDRGQQTELEALKHQARRRNKKKSKKKPATT